MYPGLPFWRQIFENWFILLERRIASIDGNSFGEVTRSALGPSAKLSDTPLPLQC